MHKSRLAGFIIDCDTDDLERAAAFWAAALGAPAKSRTDIAESKYVGLDMPPDEPYVEVQKVSHASRVHIDIESDDIPAEVSRLEGLGAKRIDEIRGWVVMEAPTGQRFCVVPVVSREFKSRANSWES
ncbi:MAG: VOC family protein [Proteobacteria bacterium]|nr:VOC family protein [Pseudomonadota bacterium]MDA0992436.1 VOC family protein [Pseudomonadota bacterium]